MDLFTIENLIAFGTLTFLEIVLGIDNIIFISILVEKLEPSRREFSRRLGLIVAMVSRLGLLLAISWIVRLTEPLFSLGSKSFSGRDLILLVGGLFLLAKATLEIHKKIDEVGGDANHTPSKASTLTSALLQILIIDLVFSLDSVITAVGMVQDIRIMTAAVVISVGVMMIFARAIGEFIEENPTFKVLALSFLLLVGVMLVVEGFGGHVEKGYIYFAIGFSLFVESINTKLRKGKPLHS